MRSLVVIVLMGMACREPGTARLEVQFDPACEAATHFDAYLVRGIACSGCSCGLCTCDGDNCIFACPDCEIDMLGSVVVDPSISGAHAAIYLFYADGRLVSSACADLVLGPDGTDDMNQVVEATCCPS
jgi:hypothetical protein